ncbi:hypothetical protein Glove_208g119 [Diversispora epigaea]|uniref:Uncharacterized protein n=1 Tax=Diversispora epigaea TaxID=1348612 RepID=A0A397ITB9_9GLOM|nr:hypothetical protein Glove_208g119 [Diversispora epigaea]
MQTNKLESENRKQGVQHLEQVSVDGVFRSFGTGKRLKQQVKGENFKANIQINGPIRGYEIDRLHHLNNVGLEIRTTAISRKSFGSGDRFCFAIQYQKWFVKKNVRKNCGLSQELMIPLSCPFLKDSLM